jgi:hypothetical protein
LPVLASVILPEKFPFNRGAEVALFAAENSPKNMLLITSRKNCFIVLISIVIIQTSGYGQKKWNKILLE